MFVASNSRCAKSVSQLLTNSYNLDEAVALKEGFVLYLLPQYEKLLASVVGPIFVLQCHVINNSVTELS